MDLRTTLTGMLPALVLVSALLTAVASALLLWLYRRATLRGMAQRTGFSEPPLKSLDEALPSGGPPLTIASHQPDAVASLPASYRRAAQSMRASVFVYTAGGLVYALILTLPWIITAGDGFVLGRLLWLVGCYAWPIVPTVSLVAAISRRQTLAIAGSYVAIVMAIALFVLARNPGLTSGQLVYFWLFANAPATLLLLAFLHRRVRAVGPLVLAFMVAGVAGAFLIIEVLRDRDELLRGIVTLGDRLGLNALALFVLLQVVGFIAFAVLGWWLLKLIGRRYQEKRLSDQSITLDALWLLFAIVQSITLAFEGWGWIFTGLVAFAGYKLVTWAGFARLCKRMTGASDPSMLLLLRVFALGQRSERLFGPFAKWWRRAGSISLIAGPDLVTTAVEPHEFLDFVSGRLSRQFVQDEADLERRIHDLDTTADPDGRFRVNEFFCRADTWQVTMRRLAKESRAVLMDLRSFSRANQGCLYELEQLLDRVDLERVTFLVDETTDRPFLEETLHGLWNTMDRESPNRRATAPTVYLFEAKDQSGRVLKALLLRLQGMPAGELCT